MTPTLHCGECGKPTDNHSLICDACAPEYVWTAEAYEASLPEFKRAAWRKLCQEGAEFADEWACLTAARIAEELENRHVQTYRT